MAARRLGLGTNVTGNGEARPPTVGLTCAESIALVPEGGDRRTDAGQTLSHTVTNAFVPRLASRPSVACSAAVLSGFRGLPQDVAVPSRFRRRESVEKIQM